MKSKPLFYAMLAALPFLVAACEPMDAVDPFGVVHDKKSDDKKSESPSDATADAAPAANSSGGNKKPSSKKDSSSKPSKKKDGGSWGTWSEKWNYD